jgi:hypothetical protein
VIVKRFVHIIFQVSETKPLKRSRFSAADICGTKVYTSGNALRGSDYREAFADVVNRIFGEKLKMKEI